MGLCRENGQRITKAAFPAVLLADPPKLITENVYQTEPYGRGDGRPEGSHPHLLYEADALVPQSVIDRLFTPATVAPATGDRRPATGPAAGGGGAGPPSSSPAPPSTASPRRNCM